MRNCPSTLPVALLFAVILAASAVSAGEDLAKVTASPDLRRVVIESSGIIGRYNAFELERPPRLVIDIDGVKPGKEAKTIPPERTGGLRIQVSESRSGTHVVLDFGGGPVPSHRIRHMDNYLIVFLGTWRAPSAGTPSTEGAEVSKPKPKAPAVRHVESTEKRNGTGSNLSDLTIKSAQVMDGIIVLKVADRANPDRLFRINLGVNLDRLGFVSAGIYPLSVNPGPVRQPQGDPRGEAANGEQGLKGPRKTSEPAVSAPASGLPNAGLPGGGSGSTKRSSASGPRKSPAPPNTSGPVGLKDDPPGSNGWKLTGIPRQPVSESARAALEARRHAPL
ncbi:MAG: AMIN domain-containing protein [Pseudomonadota bacterium]